MSAPTTETSLNIPALLERVAPLVGAAWDAEGMTAVLDEKPWEPHEDDKHAGHLAGHLGIRFKSSSSEVLAYIGESPAVDSGAVVARATVVDGDKQQAARLAALACAGLYASVPEQYRPVGKPQAAQSQPVQQQGGIPHGVSDLIHVPISEWPVEKRKEMAAALRLLACVMEVGC